MTNAADLIETWAAVAPSSGSLKMNREITITGPRQCGKTERIINLVAGGIVAGGSPVIMCRPGTAWHYEERLAARLHELGEPSPRATARRHVFTRGAHGAGRGLRGPQYFEDDWTC